METNDFMKIIFSDLQNAAKNKKRFGPLVNRLNNQRKKIDDSNVNCCVEGCEKYSVNSHLLQERGVLNNISENGHLINPDFNFFSNPQGYFKKIGINNALTFKGFCSTHDDSIFKLIEDGEPNLDEYDSQLLFLYRAVAYEFVKKRKSARILKEEIDFNGYSPRLVALYLVFLGELAEMTDYFTYMNNVYSEIENGNQCNFIFHHIIIKNETLPFGGSCLFTLENLDTGGELDFSSLDRIFFTVLPFENKTSLIIGCKKSSDDSYIKYINEFLVKTDSELKKSISDIFISTTENWVIPPSFYRKKINPHEKKILASYFETPGYKELDFNIFNL